MDQPKVSIIVPIYKSEAYLVQCLESLVSQTLNEIEILLVDEGDDDECWKIMRYYAGIDPRIVCIHAKHGGYGASVNAGIEIARGEYIGIVEADDFIEKNMYEKMYFIGEQHFADIVKCNYNDYVDKNDEFKFKKYPYFASKKIMYHVPMNKIFSARDFPMVFAFHPSIWSCLYKRQYILDHNIRFHLNRGIYLDTMFRFQAFLHTDKMVYIDNYFYNYRIQAKGSTTETWNLEDAIRRWGEVHAWFAQEGREALFQSIKQYCIKEEYVMTLRHYVCEKFTITPSFLKLMRNNFLCYDDQSITENTLFSNLDKRIIRLFKNGVMKEVNTLKKYARFNKNHYNLRKKRMKDRLTLFFILSAMSFLICHELDATTPGKNLLYSHVVMWVTGFFRFCGFLAGAGFFYHVVELAFLLIKRKQTRILQKKPVSSDNGVPHDSQSA